MVSESVWRSGEGVDMGAISVGGDLSRGRRFDLFGGVIAGGGLGICKGREGIDDTEGVVGSSGHSGLLDEHREGPGEYAELYPDELRLDSDALRSTPRKGLR